MTLLFISILYTRWVEMSEKLALINSILTRNLGPLTYHLLMHCYGLAREALWVISELTLRGGRELEPAGLSMV